MWLSGGGAIHDELGLGYTLIRQRRATSSPEPLLRAFAERGAPWQVLEIDTPAARRVYEADHVLVRPDLHVVWRGDDLPEDPHRIAAMATGHGG